MEELIAFKYLGVWLDRKMRRNVQNGQLLRKYGLEGSETWSAMEWKERVHEKNCRDWVEEVEGNSSLKWY